MRHTNIFQNNRKVSPLKSFQRLIKNSVPIGFDWFKKGLNVIYTGIYFPDVNHHWKFHPASSTQTNAFPRTVENRQTHRTPNRSSQRQHIRYIIFVIHGYIINLEHFAADSYVCRPLRGVPYRHLQIMVLFIVPEYRERALLANYTPPPENHPHPSSSDNPVRNFRVSWHHSMGDAGR